MPMKRSEINEKNEKFQKLAEVVKKAVLNLLNSDKNNVYTLHEIVETVAEDFIQRGLEMGFSKERTRRAIVHAVVDLERGEQITADRVASEVYYGSK